MKELFETAPFREELFHIVIEVDTLCNDDQSPILGKVAKSIKELITEAYNLGVSASH